LPLLNIPTEFLKDRRFEVNESELSLEKKIAGKVYLGTLHPSMKVAVKKVKFKVNPQLFQEKALQMQYSF
jgi:hypothetical protein